MTFKQALAELESATARLEAALPDNLSLAQDAMALREEAISAIGTLPVESEAVVGLQRLWERGEASLRRLRLVRAQMTVEFSNLEQQRLLISAINAGGSRINEIDCSI